MLDMYFNPDNIKLERPDLLRDDYLLKKIFERLKQKLGPYVPKPDDFREIYGDYDVDLDLKLCDALERKWKTDLEENGEQYARFQRRERIKAFIAEAIIANQFSGTWLNVEDSEFTVFSNLTAKPDDYGVTNLHRKGFDLSLEFAHNDNPGLDIYAGASIDITTSGRIETITNKFSKVISIIKKGEAPIIKYFENAAETFRGSIKVAPLVLVLSDKTLRDLFSKELAGKKEELENHPVQLSLLTQFKKQAEVFLSLSKKYNNTDLVTLYEKSLDHINYLLFKKADMYKEFDVDTENLYERYRGLGLMNTALTELLEREKDS